MTMLKVKPSMISDRLIVQVFFMGLFLFLTACFSYVSGKCDEFVHILIKV